ENSVLQVADSRRELLLVRELDPEVDPWLAAIMPDARNIAIVPLVADGVVGVLVAETGQRSGSRIERRVVATTERFAGHAATASAGVATYPYDGVDAGSLLMAADQALYASKRSGRNTVRSAEQARAAATTAAG